MYEYNTPKKLCASYKSYQYNIKKRRLIKIKCNDSESFEYSILRFEYSILFYLYYYKIKTKYNWSTEIDKHCEPQLLIHFNNNNDIYQFERDNPLIDLLIINVNNKPLFLTRNNANIKISIVKLNNYRYSLYKPNLECFNDNINEINKINSDKRKYILTDEMKKNLH